MYGLDPRQFKQYIVTPVCTGLDMATPASISLTVGTCLKESLLTYVVQLPNGPALGVGQMEPGTHEDIWKSYLAYRVPLVRKLFTMLNIEYVPSGADRPHYSELMYNLRYAVAMVRIHYSRVREPIPPNEPVALAQYWKKYYNTPAGKGNADEALKHFIYAVSL